MPTQSTPRTPTASELATPTTFPLLELTAELRLMIYDEMIDDMRESLRVTAQDAYIQPTEWPRHKLSAFANLVRTCRQLHDEAQRYFEKRVLPGLHLHFESVEELRRVWKAVQRHGLRLVYGGIPFTLRAWPLEVDDGVMRLLDHYTTYAFDDLSLHHAFGVKDHDEWFTCQRCELRLHIVRGQRLPVHVYYLPATDDGIQVVAIQLGAGDDEGRYFEMRGRLRDLESDQLEAALPKVKLCLKKAVRKHGNV